MKNRRMRTRMYGGVRGRKTKKVGRNSKIFVFLLLDYVLYQMDLRVLIVQTLRST